MWDIAMKRMPVLSLILCAFIAGSMPVRAQSTYVLTSDSRLRIEGTSTVDAFTCEAGTIVGSGHMERPEGGAGDGRLDSSDAGIALIVPVESFDCGKAKMNRDMYDALLASTHPNIGFQLDEVEVLGSNSSGDGFDLRATGRLSLAGEIRAVTFSVRGMTLPDGRLQAQGALPLLMTDFGIKPPTALFGLVRARDQITVAFELYGVSQAVAQANR